MNEEKNFRVDDYIYTSNGVEARIEIIDHENKFAYILPIIRVLTSNDEWENEESNIPIRVELRDIYKQRPNFKKDPVYIELTEKCSEKRKELDESWKEMQSIRQEKYEYETKLNILKSEVVKLNEEMQSLLWKLQKQIQTEKLSVDISKLIAKKEKLEEEIKLL